MDLVNRLVNSYKSVNDIEILVSERYILFWPPHYKCLIIYRMVNQPSLTEDRQQHFSIRLNLAFNQLIQLVNFSIEFN